MLKTEFSFAGFNFPRYLAHMPKGSLKTRAASRKNGATGGYYHAPTPNNREGIGFYLESSDGCPFGLRWQWADDVEGARIRHTGWYADECGFETIRGIVFRLPHGRGFLAGWSMGEGMASTVDFYVFDSERDAAYAADSMAERAAESERQYQEQQEAA